MIVRSFAYKCTYCGRTGKYSATVIGIALDFKCPHDGAKVTVQEPAKVEGAYITSPEPAPFREVVEFANRISDAVVKKLEAVGVKL